MNASSAKHPKSLLDFLRKSNADGNDAHYIKKSFAHDDQGFSSVEEFGTSFVVQGKKLVAASTNARFG